MKGTTRLVLSFLFLGALMVALPSNSHGQLISEMLKVTRQEQNKIKEEEQKRYDSMTEEERIEEASAAQYEKKGFWGKLGQIAGNVVTFGAAVEWRGEKYDGEMRSVYHDQDGKAYEMVYDTKTGEMISTEGNLKGCVPLAMKFNQRAECLFCSLFAVVFNASSDMATLSFDKLAAGLKIVLVVAFALWIAFQVLPFVSSLTKQEAPKFIKNILTQTMKVFIAYTFLTYSKEVYIWIIEPILIAGLEFGMAVLFNTAVETIEPSAALASITTTNNISPKVFAKLDMFLQAIQMELGFLQAIGGTLMCISWNAASFIIPDVSMLINGMMVYILSTLLLISFGFYLFDAVVQIGIVGALMPLLITAWPFKLTSKWPSAGWTMFIHSVFVFMMMGVVISIDVTLILEALGGGAQSIFDAFNSNEIEKVEKLFDIGVAGGLGLIGCIILAFKFTEQTDAIAGKFSGGSTPGIAQKLAGTAASGVTNTAKRMGATAWKHGGKDLAKAGTKAAGRLTAKGAKWVDNKALGGSVQKSSKAVKNAAVATGNATKQAAKWTGNKMTAAGNKALEKSGAKALGNKIADTAQKTGQNIKNSKVGQAVGKATDKTKDFLEWDRNADGVRTKAGGGGIDTSTFSQKAADGGTNASKPNPAADGRANASNPNPAADGRANAAAQNTANTPEKNSNEEFLKEMDKKIADGTLTKRDYEKMQDKAKVLKDEAALDRETVAHAEKNIKDGKAPRQKEIDEYSAKAKEYYEKASQAKAAGDFGAEVEHAGRARGNASAEKLMRATSQKVQMSNMEAIQSTKEGAAQKENDAAKIESRLEKARGVAKGNDYEQMTKNHDGSAIQNPEALKNQQERFEQSWKASDDEWGMKI